MVQRAVRFTPQALLSAPRRSAGVPNASGTRILYTTTAYSFQTHQKTTELRVLDVESGESVELPSWDGISDLNWLNDEEYVCLRAEQDGTTSLCWVNLNKRPLNVDFNEQYCVAGTIDGPAGDLRVKQLGEGSYAVAVSAQANPDGSLFNTSKAKKLHSTGKLYNGLFVRHWDRWETRQKNSLWYGRLSVTDSPSSKYKLSALKNALDGTGLECPIRPFGGIDNFDISGSRIIFTAKDPTLNPALNTGCHVYIADVPDWNGSQSTKVTQINVPGQYAGAATSPVFSPNGKSIAFLKMATNGYEADRNSIFIARNLHVGEVTAVECVSSYAQWDRSPQSVCFTADNKKILVTAENLGNQKLFEIDVNNSAIHKLPPRPLTHHGSVSDVHPLSGGQIFVSGSSITDNSYFAIIDPSIPDSSRSSLSVWSHSNSGNGEKFGLSSSQVSSIWTPASNPMINKEVHSIVVKPSDFDSGKKYPVAYLIHGGPQGAWADSWSTRWNLAVFAEQGYICIAPNPTGSTGYGQAFTDSIRRNWGGDPYRDIVNVFDWVGENMPEADNDRAVALGASYGGYMMNWIQGHDLGRKLKCLVCHDGITSFAGAMLGTDELYFPLYDLGGTPWFDPGFKPAPGDASAIAQTHNNFGSAMLSDWRKWDPSEHFANWSTPQLLIHSSKDYRLPIAEGLAAFNVLQMRNVDSQLLTFDDENHWILKPENSLLWHKVVLNWINKYAGLKAFAEEDEASDELYGGVRAENEGMAEMPAQGRVEM